MTASIDPKAKPEQRDLIEFAENMLGIQIFDFQRHVLESPCALTTLPWRGRQ